MRNFLNYFCLFIIFIEAVSCTNPPVKDNATENIKAPSPTSANNSTNSATLLEKIQGTWMNIDSKDDRSISLFEVKGDTSIYMQNEKYKISITNDSLFSETEILSKQSRKTIEPKMSIPQKICTLTNDSLIFSNWVNGQKKYTHYYKKKA